MQIKKRMSVLILACILMCAMSMAVYAHEVPDQSRKGSIQVTMKRNGRIVSGGTLTLHRVGDIREEDGNYGFELTGEFAASGLSLDHISSPELAEKLSNYVSDNKIEGLTKSIGKDGTASFEDLKAGLYLIVQNQAASGYYQADPFLVSVPMNENGEYLYAVDASPKVELVKKGGGKDHDPDPTPTDPTPTEPEPSEPWEPETGVLGAEDHKTGVLGASDVVLPQTGQLNWPIPVMVIAGLGLFSAGWMIRFGKKKEKDER